MAGERVLIIDDSAELISVLETILPYGGYEVLSALTGEEGLDLVSEGHPDVILIDLELPDTTGLKVLEALNERGLSIPTIMMTGYGSEGVAARALRLGVRDYLIKPFTTEEVLSSVERALEESRLRREKERLAGLLSGFARHFTLVSAIGRSVVAGPDLEEALQRIVSAGLFITRAEGAFLLVLDEVSGKLRMMVAEGKAKRVTKRFVASAGDERLRPVLEKGAAVRLHATGASTIELQTSDRVRAVLEVPIGGRGQFLGLLAVDRRSTSTPFNKYDEQILRILADYAAMTLEQERQTAEAVASKEEMLRTSAYLSSTAELLDDAVFISDLDGYVQFTNPALARILEQPVEQLVGKRAVELFDDAEPLVALADWIRTVSSQDLGCVEVSCRMPHGRLKKLGLHLARVSDPRGEVLGLIGLVQEMSSAA